MGNRPQKANLIGSPCATAGEDQAYFRCRRRLIFQTALAARNGTALLLLFLLSAGRFDGRLNELERIAQRVFG